jgi:hypothetical protein
MADEVENKPVLVKALTALLEASQEPDTAKVLKIETLHVVRSVNGLLMAIAC